MPADLVGVVIDQATGQVVAPVRCATPGTAWIEYEPDRDMLLIHVFDLVDEDAWISLIKSRYEALLIEIFTDSGIGTMINPTSSGFKPLLV